MEAEQTPEARQARRVARGPDYPFPFWMAPLPLQGRSQKDRQGTWHLDMGLDLFWGDLYASLSTVPTPWIECPAHVRRRALLCVRPD